MKHAIYFRGLLIISVYKDKKEEGRWDRYSSPSRTYMSWWNASLVHVANSCGSGLEADVLLGHFASTKNLPRSPIGDGDMRL